MRFDPFDSGVNTWQYCCWNGDGDGGGGGGGGGGSDNKSTSTSRGVDDVQADINAALEASGGEWTAELNDLVSERESLKGSSGDKGTAEYNAFGDRIDSGAPTDVQLQEQSTYAQKQAMPYIMGLKDPTPLESSAYVASDPFNPATYKDDDDRQTSSFNMFGDDTSAGAPTDETLSSLSAAAAATPDPFDPATYDNVTVTGDPSKDDGDSTSAFFANLGATPAAAATKENEVFGPEDFAPYP